MSLLEDAHLTGIPIEYLKDSAKTCRNWSSFQSDLYEYMDELSKPADGT
jgi:hypothetical protein